MTKTSIRSSHRSKRARRGLAQHLATIGTIMLTAWAASAIAQEQPTTLEQMPAELEKRFALSALPPQLREEATIYLLDPEKGYELAIEGTSGVTCIVQRTVWEMADFRDDIYIPLCYDAAGTSTYLHVIMEAARIRAEGMGPQELKSTIARRWEDGTYQVPERAGMSYMVAPVQRTIGPPDLEVITLSLPHFMPYAPGVSNQDIGAHPDLADPASLQNPFIERQGIDEQSYFIHMVGVDEKADILNRETDLVKDLCAYRDVLCLADAD
ncbi:hypothetical protein [Chelativorans salis]|uniref:Uncharacterized protein n=1 Tax=Chelativorans salis TaxID=2978478 RepID=A0ABT2LLT9_9HYPH|nr:hypothetical protein [Chelativorans sp. EGI FJ00035]MCT7374343.1 hypothetical protein [Chelativorans sp. EGI FJ00035]